MIGRGPARPDRGRRCATRALLSALAWYALLPGTAATADAHEIGKTQVVATLNVDGTYQFDIAVDPDALLTQLEVARNGRVTAAVAGRAERDRAIAAHAPEFLARVHVTFDAESATPAFAYTPPSRIGDAAQSAGQVRLTGRVPADARSFRFQYDLAGGTFALVARVHAQPARTIWVEPLRPSESVELVALGPPPDTSEVALQYFGLGFTHILPKGLDHILFVLGLFLLSTRWRPVLAQISAFTVAHSITLALTAYGLVSLPARLVEPLIALSIAYVAIENLLTTELKSWRVALVFGFGLLHGMGFASVLRDLGLPRHEFLTALLTFNMGVEAGQLAVIALATLLIGRWRSQPAVYRRWIALPSSVAIGVMAIVWTVQRLL